MFFVYISDIFSAAIQISVVLSVRICLEHQRWIDCISTVSLALIILQAIGHLLLVYVVLSCWKQLNERPDSRHKVPIIKAQNLRTEAI